MTTYTSNDNPVVTPETSYTLQELRQKARDNTATTAELRHALTLLRGDRIRAQATSAKSKTAKAATAAKKDIDSDALLGELGVGL